MRFRRGAVLGFVVVLAVTLLVGTMSPASGAAAESECQPVENRQVCLQDFSAPESLLIGGENGSISVTVENVGSVEAEALVVLNTNDPNNQTASFPLARPTLAPGESQTIEQPLNATTPGSHGLRVIVVDSATGQQYDTSETVGLEVRSEPEPGLGGPIDRVEIALVALVAALVGIVALGLRIRN